MKKLLALSAILILLISAPAFAGPPSVVHSPTDKVAVKPKKEKKEKEARREITPRPVPAPAPVLHGKKKGWSKNTHNPHNANCNNPGQNKKNKSMR